MEASLAARLNTDDKAYDQALYNKLGKMSRDYVQAGAQTTGYWISDLDACNDLSQAWASVAVGDCTGNGANFDRVGTNRFIHPMGATEMTTLTTFISQILFGGATTRKVEPRQDDDEKAADLVNELLQWNDDQQATYNQGYLWIWDAVVFNRGVMYDHWEPTFVVDTVPVYEEKTDDAGQPIDRDPNADPIRFKKQRTPNGGFNKINLISPYDFISDPMFPPIKFQEGRFAGHRISIAWQELERRSKLDVTDPLYVLPWVVKKLKNRPVNTGMGLTNSVTSPSIGMRSRSYYERLRAGNPVGVLGAADRINREDGGVIECFVVYVRMPPKTYDIYDDTEPEIIEFLIAGELELLSVNVMPNKHDQYPYSIGEARPNAHMAFSPSWAMIIKPIQDWVDYLKDRKAASLSKTAGNMFLYDPASIDITQVTDPQKDGLVMAINQEAAGKPFDQILRQIPIQDLTANFYRDMEMWIGQAEVASGAHPYMQGTIEGGDPTATEVVATQQMGTGRVSSMARLLSVGGLCPQTKRFVCNFQQFAPEKMVVRITGDKSDFDPDTDDLKKFETIEKTDIQGEFDIIPSDGALPGTDSRKVAALTRLMEAADDPATAQYFDDTVPGNLSMKLILYEASKASGVKLRNFVISKSDAQKNLMLKSQAQGIPVQQGPDGQPMITGAQPPQAPPASPVPVAPGLSIPDASSVPSPTGTPTTPSPATV